MSPARPKRVRGTNVDKKATVNGIKDEVTQQEAKNTVLVNQCKEVAVEDVSENEEEGQSGSKRTKENIDEPPIHKTKSKKRKAIKKSKIVAVKEEVEEKDVEEEGGPSHRKRAKKEFDKPPVNDTKSNKGKSTKTSKTVAVKKEVEEKIGEEKKAPSRKKKAKGEVDKLSMDGSASTTTKRKRQGKASTKRTLTKSSTEAKAEAKVESMTPAPKKKIKKGEDVPVPRPLTYKSLGKGPPSVPSTGCKYMGCHVSAAGGIWNAFENAKECSSKSFAIFLRNQRQWNAKALDEETIKKWEETREDFAPHLILPHGSYLMNLGSPVADTLDKSRRMLLDELQRCERLGIPHYNFHPGSTTGLITREECCKVIAESINIAHSQTKGVICVLENMSCQGFTIGGDFHELRLIIEHVKDKSRVGICLDTCHSHAAGYDLSTEEGFKELLQDFEQIIGWQFLRGLHINDSKGKAGDHLDRHENIGKGTIGIEGFRRVMNCKHFNDLPLILETPWISNAGYAAEVRKLESLIK